MQMQNALSASMSGNMIGNNSIYIPSTNYVSPQSQQIVQPKSHQQALS